MSLFRSTKQALKKLLAGLRRIVSRRFRVLKKTAGLPFMMERLVEKEIVAIERSTRATFPFLAKLHNHLCQKYDWYYKWHLHPLSNKTHSFALLAVAVAAFACVYPLFSISKADVITATQTSKPTLTTQTINITNNPDKFYLNDESGKPNQAYQVSSTADGTTIKTKSATPAGYQQLITNGNESKLYDGDKLVADATVQTEQKDASGNWQNVEIKKTINDSNGDINNPVSKLLNKAKADVATVPDISSSVTTKTPDEVTVDNSAILDNGQKLKINVKAGLGSPPLQGGVSGGTSAADSAADKKPIQKQTFDLDNKSGNVQRLYWDIQLKDYDIKTDSSTVIPDSSSVIPAVPAVIPAQAGIQANDSGSPGDGSASPRMTKKEYGPTIIDCSDYAGPMTWVEDAATDTVRVYFDEEGTTKAINIDPILTVTQPTNQIVVNDGTHTWKFDSSVAGAPMYYYDTRIGSGATNLASTTTSNPYIGPGFGITGALSASTQTLVENTPTRVVVRSQGSYATSPTSIDSYYTIYPDGRGFLKYTYSVPAGYTNPRLSVQHYLSAVPEVQSYDDTNFSVVQSDSSNNNYPGMSVVPYTTSEFGGTGGGWAWLNNDNSSDRTMIYKSLSAATYTGNMAIDFSNFRATTTTRDALRDDYRHPITPNNFVKGTISGDGYDEGSGAYTVTANATGDSQFDLASGSYARVHPAITISKAAGGVIRAEDVYQVQVGGVLKTKGIDYNLSEPDANTVTIELLSTLAASTTTTIEVDAGTTANEIWTNGHSTGIWSDAANWSTGVVPQATDNVVFGATSTANCSVDASSTPTVASLTIAPSYSGTITVAKAMTISGDFSLEGGTFNAASYVISIGGNYSRTGGTFTAGTSTITMTATTTGHTFTAGGQTYKNVTFNGAGGAWTLQDTLTLTAATGTLTLTRGTLNTNGQTVNAGILSSANSNTRTLNITNSTINLSGTATTVWGMSSASNLTFTGTGSAVVFSGASPTLYFETVAMAFNNISFTGGGTITWMSGVTDSVVNLTITGSASTTDQLTLNYNYSRVLTISGTLTINGNSPSNRILVTSAALGSYYQLTAHAVNLSNVDFRDITGAGSAAPFTGTSIGDCGGNTSITATTAVPKYWVGNGGSWSDATNHWATVSNGTAGVNNIPLPQDDVYFDSHSFSSNSQTVTSDMPRLGKSISWTGATNSPTWSLLSIDHTMYGSLTLISGMTATYADYSKTLYFAGRVASTLTTAGQHNWANKYTFQMLNGSMTQNDTFMTGGVFTLSSGTYSNNGYNFYSNGFTVSSGSTITLSGTVMLASGNDVVISTTATVNMSTANITQTYEANNTYGLGSHTYGSLTFPYNANGGNTTISGNNTFGNFTVGKHRTVTFTNSTTQIISGTFNATGTAADPITLKSDSSSVAATLSKASGAVFTNYSTITYLNVTGGASWYGGANDTITNSTGWNASTPAIWTGTTNTNWSNTGNWSTGAVPTNTTDVVLTGTVSNAPTIDATANAKTLTLTSSFGNTLSASAGLTVAGDVNIAGGTFSPGSQTINVGGNWTLANATFTAGTSTINMTATSTGKTFTSGNQTYGNLTFNGVGGSWTLQDPLTTLASTQTGMLTLTNGTLNTNSQPVSIGAFASTINNVRTLTLGSSAITVTGSVNNSNDNNAWYFGSASNMTVTANTAVATFTGSSTSVHAMFVGGTCNWNGMSVVFNGGGTQYIANGGMNTFANITFAGKAVKTDSFLINAGYLAATNTFTISGNSATNRLLVYSLTLGSAATLTAAAVNLSNVDFQDITFAGTMGGTGSSTSIGDAGGNSGTNWNTTNFPAAAVPKYWVGNGGSWSDATHHWATASNGSAGANNIPLPQDDVYFDSHSFSTASQTVTGDMPRIGKSIDWTGATGNPTWGIDGGGYTSYGSLTLISAMAVTKVNGNAHILQGRGSFNITSAGQAYRGLNIQAIGGTYTLQDAFLSNYTFTVTNGTFNANNYNVTADKVSINPSNKTTAVTMGSGTWTVTGSGTYAWYLVASNLTLTANTSTISLTDTSSNAKTFWGGGGKTYNNLSITGGGTGAWTFNDANTFNNFTIGAPKTVTFLHGVTQVINGAFTALGTNGNAITLQSDSGSAATLSKTSGLIFVDYATINYVNVTGGASWDYGANSTVTNSTGWNTSAPAVWTGGGGANTNWSSTSNWSTGALPTSGTDVIFSGSTTNSVIDSSFTNSIKSLTSTPTYANTLSATSGLTVVGDVNVQGGTVSPGSQTINVGGNWNLANATLTAGTSTVKMTNTSGTKTVTSGGQSFYNFTMDGVGGTTQFSDAFATLAAGTLTLTNGTLNTNGQTLNIGAMSSSNSNTRTLTLGASVITVAGNWSFATYSGLTFNCGTSSITFTGNSAGLFPRGMTFYDVAFTGGGGSQGIAYTSGAGNPTFHNLSVTGGTTAKTDHFGAQSGNQINVTGLLTLAGNSTTSRLLVEHTAATGTPLTINAANFSLSNVDFKDITAAGATPFTGTSLGDCGGNSNITMTPADTETWDGSTNNWSSAHWAGGSVSRVPLPQDNVVLGGGTGTITADMPRLGKNISFTSAMNLRVGTSVTSYGSVDFSGAGTVSGGNSWTFESGTSGARSGTQTFTSNGKSLFQIAVQMSGATLQLNDNVTLSGSYGTVWGWNSGTLVTNGHAINLTGNAGLSETFAGGGKTYSDIAITGGTSSVTFSGANTFNNFTIGAPKTVTFANGTTQTINGTLTATGTAANIITLNSDSAGVAATISHPSAFATQWNSIKDITSTGTGASWAAQYSTSVSGNTGITFPSFKTVSDSGGTRNWSDTASWIQGVVPVSGDDVVATATSGALAVNADSANLNSANFSAYTNTLSGANAITVAPTSGTVNVLFGGTINWTGTLNLNPATGTEIDLTTNTKTLSNITQNGAGTVKLLDALTQINSSRILTLTAGTLNTNGQTMSIGQMQAAAATYVRALTLGSSNITVTGSVWNTSSNVNITYDYGTSNITLTYAGAQFAAPQTVYNVTFTGGGASFLGNTTTLHNLTVTGSANTTDTFYTNSGSGYTVNGTFTVNGNSPTNRVLVYSGTLGSARTVTANAVSFSNVDFRDITFAGTMGGTTSSSSIGDAGGNSGTNWNTTNFPTAADTETWDGSTNNWSSAHWTGVSVSRVPLPQDTVHLYNGGTVSANMPRLGKDISFANSTGLTLSNAVTSYGSLDFTNAGTFNSGTNGWTFESGARTGTNTLTSNSKVFGGAVNISTVGATFRLVDAFNCNYAGGYSLTLNNGTFNANNQTVTIGSFTSNNSNTRAITMGSGTWTLNGVSGTVWQTGTTTALTFNANTSTISITNTTSNPISFTSGLLTFNNFTIAGGGTGVLTILGSHTFNNFTIGAPKTVTFANGTTQTINGTFTATGTNGNIITINSDLAGSAATLSKATGVVSGDYLLISDSVATGGADWFAGAHSSNVTQSTNSGWTFTAPTGANRYWVGSAGNWSETTHWAKASGGTAGWPVPTSADTAIFDGNVSGNTDCNIDTAANVANLTLTSGYTHALTQNANLTVGSTLTLNSVTGGTLSVGANTLNLNGPTLVGTASKLVTTSSSTLSFGGSSSSVTMPSSVVALNNLTINNANGVALNSSPTISGTLTLTSGAFAVGTNTLTLNGPTTAGTTSNLSTTSSSNLVFGGSSSGVNYPTGATALNNLTINNANGLNLNSASPTVNGTLTLTSGNVTGGTINAAGNIVVTSTGGNATYNISGTGVQTLSGAGANSSLTSGQVTINSGADLQLAATTTITKMTVALGGTLDLNGQNFTSTTPNFIDNGTLRLTGDETTTTPTLGADSTVEYTATSSSRPIQNWTYSNLKINGAGTFTLPGTITVSKGLTLSAGVLAGGSNNINVAGNWTANGGTFSAGSSTVNLNGAGGTIETVNGSTTFNNLTATTTSARTLQFAHGATQIISGALTLSGVANNLLTIDSDSAGVSAKLSKSSTIMVFSYVSVTDITAEGGANWYLALTSTPSPNPNINGNSGWSSDTTAPSNPTTTTATVGTSPAVSIANSSWINQAGTINLTFSGAVDPDSGISGYYTYWGTDSAGTPTTFQAQVSDPQTFSTTITTADNGKHFYFRLYPKDNVGNPTNSTPVTLFNFGYDITKPNAPSSVTAEPQGWTTQDSFTLSWPPVIDPVGGAGDSGIQYYKYKTGADGATWSHTADATDRSVSGVTSYQPGINLFYVKAVDWAGNESDQQQGSYNLSGPVPSAPGNLQVSPNASTANNFTISWNKSILAKDGDPAVEGYYYSVNIDPMTLTAAEVTKIMTKYPSTDDHISIPNLPLATAQGANTLYVLAYNENDENGGFDQAIYSKQTFTCQTPAPASPVSVSLADSSNRAYNTWALTMSWDASPNQNQTTFDHYAIERSTNGVDFTQLATTKATAYIDVSNLNNSTTYSYRIKAVDNAKQSSAPSSVVQRKPIGNYLTPPALLSSPTVSAIKASSATVSWLTDRESSSIIHYGTSASALSASDGQYDAVTTHSVALSGLTPGSVYYYKIQSMDEFHDYTDLDAYSETFAFTTMAAPAISATKIANITLTSANIFFTTTTVSTSTLYYGPTTAYGSEIADISGADSTNHTIALSDLSPGTTYHFRTKGVDINNNLITSDDYQFDTLPLPKVENLKISTVPGQPQSAFSASWTTNVPTTTIIRYRASNGDWREIVQSESEAIHSVQVNSLSDNTVYEIVVSGRDGLGDLVESPTTTFTTPYDTRPPVISGLTVTTSMVGSGINKAAQASVGWKTDEPATAKVEYGQGADGPFTDSTAQQADLVNQRSVNLSNLVPSTVYHMKVVVTDKAGNVTESASQVFVTSSSQQSAWELIQSTIFHIFGFWLKNYEGSKQ